MIVIGIDFGKDLVGVGIVDQYPTCNIPVDAFTINVKSAVNGVQSAIESRRITRHIRRSNQWYRKPKSKERRLISVTGAIYKNAKGKNDGLQKKCKYVDRETDKVCEKNTPKMKNIKDLLMQDILDHMEEGIRDSLKKDIKGCICTKAEDMEEAGKTKKEIDKEIRKDKKKITSVLAKKYGILYYTVKQLINIQFENNKKRAEFCSEHFLEHHRQTTIAKNIAWLPPSERYRTEIIIGEIKKRLREKGIANIGKIVIEVGRFDLQKIKSGHSLSPDEYMEGEKLGYANLKSALFYEQLTDERIDKGRKAICAYCGKSFESKDLQIEHIYPKGYDTYNSWENLVLACRPCNEKKCKRLPQEAGMETPLKFSLTKSRAYKKAVKSMQSSSLLREKLREEFKVNVDDTYGYITSRFRSEWFGNRENLGDKVHAIDGIIIASRKEWLDKHADMQLKPETDNLDFSIIEKKYTKQIKQRDTEPFEIKKDNSFPIQRTAIESLKLSEIKHILDDKCREAILNLECQYKDESCLIRDVINKTKDSKDKNLTLKEVSIDSSRLWFRRVKIEKSGLGVKQMVKIKNGYYRPVVKGVYGIIYQDNDKINGYIFKNPLYYQNEKFKADQILLKIKRGDVFTILDTKTNKPITIKVQMFNDNSSFKYIFLSEDNKKEPSLNFASFYKMYIMYIDQMQSQDLIKS